MDGDIGHDYMIDWPTFLFEMDLEFDVHIIHESSLQGWSNLERLCYTSANSTYVS